MHLGEKVFWFEILETHDELTVLRFEGFVMDGPQNEFPTCKPKAYGSERRIYVDKIASTYEEVTQKIVNWLRLQKSYSLKKYNTALRQFESGDTD